MAIWYDEFLTPGEDFTKAIASALQKSSLFALVVTPNLVNEENYVMTTEYPAARREQKPILPVELVHTDPKALEAHYAEFPGCIDGKNLPALSASLLKTLQNLARNRSGNNPQHAVAPIASAVRIDDRIFDGDLRRAFRKFLQKKFTVKPFLKVRLGLLVGYQF